MKTLRVFFVLSLCVWASGHGMARNQESPAETARKAKRMREITARVKRIFSAIRSGENVAVKTVPVFKSLSDAEAASYGVEIRPTAVLVQTKGIDSGRKTLRVSVTLPWSAYNRSLAEQVPRSAPLCGVGTETPLAESGMCLVPTYVDRRNAFAVVAWTVLDEKNIEVLTVGAVEYADESRGTESANLNPNPVATAPQGMVRSARGQF